MFSPSEGVSPPSVMGLFPRMKPALNLRANPSSAGRRSASYGSSSSEPDHCDGGHVAEAGAEDAPPLAAGLLSWEGFASATMRKPMPELAGEPADEVVEEVRRTPPRRLSAGVKIRPGLEGIDG